MEKERQYQFDKVEICRNCGGTGMAAEEERTGLMGRIGRMIPHATKPPLPPKTGRCPVCEGSGRVKKHTEITVKVRSFEG